MVVFSKNISLVAKEEVFNILGVRESERHENYLGLPSALGKTKGKVFVTICECVWKKVKDWKETLLSKAGNDVLIKVVA